jgi:hypothetical protein
MKILVVDVKESRHVEHVRKIREIFPNADREIKKRLIGDAYEFEECDILVVHGSPSNPEWEKIAKYNDAPYKRIIFSGGFQSRDIDYEEGEKKWKCSFSNLKNLYREYKDILSQ